MRLFCDSIPLSWKVKTILLTGSPISVLFQNPPSVKPDSTTWSWKWTPGLTCSLHSSEKPGSAASPPGRTIKPTLTEYHRNGKSTGEFVLRGEWTDWSISGTISDSPSTPKSSQKTAPVPVPPPAASWPIHSVQLTRPEKLSGDSGNRRSFLTQF